MPRAAPHKRVLTALLVRRAAARDRAFMIWDTKARGLALRVEPTGYKAFKFVYSRAGRPRWYNIGPADSIALNAARAKAADLAKRVLVNGEDPQAERVAQRTDGTFQQLADRYLEHAKRKNRSWRQARSLVERFLLPKWAKLQASEISRADVRAIAAGIKAPIVVNQTLAAASAIFTWAVREDMVKENPVRLVERNPTRSRERVLSDQEIPLLWSALEDVEPVAAAALRVLLLTGQRPGEVAQMRAEHVVDGWWTMPGEPDPKIGWPGTKNKATHRVWLPQRAQEIVRSLTDADEVGFVFAGQRGGPPNLKRTMADAIRRIGIPRATPHDLRRTFSTRMMELGFGRDCLNRVTNHKEGGIASVYDRHHYAEENRRAIEATAARLLQLAEGAAAANVLPFTR